MRVQNNRTTSRSRTRKSKRAHRRQIWRILCYTVLIGLCCYGLWRLEAGREHGQKIPPLPSKIILTDKESETPDYLLEGIADIKLNSLYSKYAVLLDADTGEVLAEKNSKERIYPASMTKLMAALVAVERTEKWDVEVEIPQNIYTKLYLEHASLAGFEPDEKVTPEDLLYGMLLPSGAECCTAYALWLASDEETFVEWMNDKAGELGMEGTHFMNTTGLHDENHYSTVEDMAILLHQCLQNETLRLALSTSSYQTTPTIQHPQGLTLESTLFQALESQMDESDTDLLGGKTGYTSQAGLCLASFADIGGREYILVTAGADGSHYTEPFHIEDALNVYNQLSELSLFLKPISIL